MIPVAPIHPVYGRLLAGDHRHGTRNGYVTGLCRCEPCKDAQNSYVRELRRRNKAAGLPKNP